MCVSPPASLRAALLLVSFATLCHAVTVVVYSATGGGFAAAIAAARGGANVTLVGATGGGGTGNHIGGMVTGGLQHTDCGNASVIGGITREFFVRVEHQYPNRSADPNLQPCTGPPCWLFEAHVAERVMVDMLSEAGVHVVTGQEGVAGVERSGSRILRFTTFANGSFTGDVFIDASYEGDLLAAAGASMTFGRESAAQYGEPGAGVRPLIGYDQLPHGIDPLGPDGAPLPLMTTVEPFASVGSADAKLEAYTYRLCMTRAPSQRVPVTEPPGYNSSTFELFRRFLAVVPGATRETFLACLGPVPTTNYTDCPADANVTQRWCKCDMIGGGALGSDLPGVSWGWPEGECALSWLSRSDCGPVYCTRGREYTFSPLGSTGTLSHPALRLFAASLAGRRALAAAYASYVQGLIWFLQTDAAVPPHVRADMADYGLCADEFLDTEPPHWPHQLYVREARRLVGDFVLSQTALPPALAVRSIGLGSYAYDAHTIQRGVREVAGTPRRLEAVNEGEITSQPPAYQPAYRIPFDALLPARNQLTNALAAVAVSASHVVFTSLRMEPTWMIMGQAAGAAAAVAARTGGDVQDVDVAALQAALVAAGQIIEP